MDGILGYPSLPRQQLLALDPNIYGGEPFRHGLTPPQLNNEQIHSYGKKGDWSSKFKRNCSLKINILSLSPAASWQSKPQFKVSVVKCQPSSNPLSLMEPCTLYSITLLSIFFIVSLGNVQWEIERQKCNIWTQKSRIILFKNLINSEWQKKSWHDVS